jgi:hypothetical protein
MKENVNTSIGYIQNIHDRRAHSVYRVVKAFIYAKYFQGKKYQHLHAVCLTARGCWDNTEGIQIFTIPRNEQFYCSVFHSYLAVTCFGLTAIIRELKPYEESNNYRNL